MSIVRIGNKAQLDSFLRILHEEKLGKESSLKSRQETMSQRIQDDLQKYGEIEEQEEEEAEESPEGGEDSSPEDEEGELVEPDEEGEVAGPEPSDEEEGEIETSPDVTYYKVRDQINDIRAAPSLKGKEVKQDMEQWLSRLDDSEKSLLYDYLITVDKIMRSQVTGTDAQDPSEPPTSISISGGDSESGEESEEPEEERREEEPAPGEEDTSPPIKAGAGQDLSEVRARLRQLMRN